MSLLGTINPNLNPARANVTGSDLETDQTAASLVARWHDPAASVSTDDTALEKFDEVGNEEIVEAEVTRLAQQLTRQSTHFSITGDGVENTFLESKEDSTLNPHSPSFKAKNWMKNLLAITSRDPERYPQRAAGVSFRNLSVHGYGSPTDYQKDVFNSVLQVGALFRMINGTGKQKIQILRDFDGLVKSGEMLVVLGRPGRLEPPSECFDICTNSDCF